MTILHHLEPSEVRHLTREEMNLRRWQAIPMVGFIAIIAEGDEPEEERHICASLWRDVADDLIALHNKSIERQP